jgi:hypothetical protein
MVYEVKRKVNARFSAPCAQCRRKTRVGDPVYCVAHHDAPMRLTKSGYERWYKDRWVCKPCAPITRGSHLHRDWEALPEGIHNSPQYTYSWEPWPDKPPPQEVAVYHDRTNYERIRDTILDLINKIKKLWHS